jgi:hypothetical protein
MTDRDLTPISTIHDRVAREKAKEEEAALKKKQGQKEEEESATPTTTPASKQIFPCCLEV